MIDAYMLIHVHLSVTLKTKTNAIYTIPKAVSFREKFESTAYCITDYSIVAAQLAEFKSHRHFTAISH